MDLTTLSIPERLQLLSSLSYDISPFSLHIGIPQKERRFKGDRLVRQLLDALVFFLHTRPNRGDRFSMTLTVVQNEIVATVAANTPDDIPPSDPNSPQTILDTVWRHMVACSGTAQKPTENTQFATYVLEAHLPLLRSRLSKWRVCYESFRQCSSRFQQSSSLLPAIRSYLNDVDKIFCATVAFSESSKTLAEKFVGEFAAHIELCDNLSKQSAKLSGDDRKLLSAFQTSSGKGADTKRYIDVIRFGEKLASPLRHISTVLYFCTNPKYQDFLTKPFRIRILPNPPSIDMPTLSNNWTKEEVAAVIRRSYTIGWPGCDPEAVTSAIDHLSGVAMDNIGKTRISGPHCDCLLVQHHHNEARGELIMETYIAISKPCCLQCGLFLDGYNQAVPNGPIFFIRRRNNHIYPSVVPSIDVVIDGSIEEKMRRKLSLLIAYVVDSYVKDLYARIMAPMVFGNGVLSELPPLSAITDSDSEY